MLPCPPRPPRAIIKCRAAAADLQGRFSGHSLRVGSAQSLAASGASLVEMQTAGTLAVSGHAGTLCAGPAGRSRGRRPASLWEVAGGREKTNNDCCDTSKARKRWRFDRKQAEALVESFATDLYRLATKADVLAVKSDLYRVVVVTAGGLHRYHRRTVDHHAGNRVKCLAFHWR